MARLTLLHLSDIHFHQYGELDNLLDYDLEVRAELERDLTTLMAQVGPIDAVVVTGDIAFSGQESEYKKADEWLRKLCAIAGCPPSAIWTTPGNHDVDRKLIVESLTLRMYHKQIREAGAAGLDSVLGDLIQDPLFRNAIFRPIAAYNEFAAAFGCEVSPERPFWEHDFSLEEGYKLRVRGLTSTMVSDQLDSDGDGRLAVGLIQSRINREEGIEYMVMCHHPPEWLIDRDEVATSLNARARIQLFGHKHSQMINRIDDSLRISAGAAHPDRREANWLPRYNLLQLGLQRATEESFLATDVYPRVWDPQSRAFQALFTAGKDHQDHRLPVGPQTRAAMRTLPLEAELVSSLTVPEPGDSTEERELAEARRTLNYRFWRLPDHRRIAVVERLGLLEDRDKDLPQVELFTAAFQRVTEAGCHASGNSPPRVQLIPHPLFS